MSETYLENFFSQEKMREIFNKEYNNQTNVLTPEIIKYVRIFDYTYRLKGGITQCETYIAEISRGERIIHSEEDNNRYMYGITVLKVSYGYAEINIEDSIDIDNVERISNYNNLEYNMKDVYEYLSNLKHTIKCKYL